jgi:hypothetical protein
MQVAAKPVGGRPTTGSRIAFAADLRHNRNALDGICL